MYRKNKNFEKTGARARNTPFEFWREALTCSEKLGANAKTRPLSILMQSADMFPIPIGETSSWHSTREFIPVAADSRISRMMIPRALFGSGYAGLEERTSKR
uniref:Uncharacterized protein n=1 Tax=Candidatus Kentrum sp. TC TaxID=2126339 RepID=A0A450ZJ89_9GAMM|nr:MAG: hypothetical protein BECKTC1821E_GA0114239_101312 [Candidatus Kentron sp. TC]VFK53817.1 MAG: hypothetical protein BECKTC1821F_GA0114240_100391 [Candidatus Kentron sp. TC]